MIQHFLVIQIKIVNIETAYVLCTSRDSYKVSIFYLKPIFNVTFLPN